jgi:hypothetical protein
MYHIDGRAVLFDWLASESDPEHRTLMLEWLAGLVQEEDPGANPDVYRVPGITAPVYIAVTPVRNVIVKFLLARRFFTIKLIEFDTLP